MIGYESTPTKQIKAIYEITKGIHNTDKGEEIEFELVEKLLVIVNAVLSFITVLVLNN